jgi:hypothetical protein
MIVEVGDLDVNHSIAPQISTEMQTPMDSLSIGVTIQ